jgi:lipopolysaccharide export system protein LptA
VPLPIYHLRRLLAVITVLFIAVVAGMYFYARLRQHSVLKDVPGKISYDIKQTANGFQFSKSEAGRTVFTIHAKDVKEFKLNGRAELHDVSIVLYGRDTSRFDRIYGDDFTFDPKSGNVTAQGDVQIDLQANPAGDSAPDQTTPKDLKNPIHLSTKDLVFNRDSGDASTDARVDFQTPQASGWAVGVHYSAKVGVLTLASQVHVLIDGENSARLFATHGTISRDPRVVVLEQPRMEREDGTLQSEQATFILGPENEVQRILASGDVRAESAAKKDSEKKDENKMRARADEAELLLVSKQNLLRTATLNGHVHVERVGDQPMQGDAGHVVLDFLGQNVLQKAHASEGVRLAQHSGKSKQSAADGSGPQDFDITAPVIDFFVANGKRLNRAQTSGAARITISPAQDQNAAAAQRTTITAGRFDAKFVPTAAGTSQLASMHGGPDAKIVSTAQGQPDRVSTSQTLDATFLPEGGVASIVQEGNVAYTDNQEPAKRTQAWAGKAVYTPPDQILQLTGNPRISDGGMVTTADVVRINRATDDSFASGNVKTTYNELKEQPNGALLASSSPIHVTAATMTAHNSPPVALYEGNARLWQDANIIEAPSIQFDRDHRSLVAQGNTRQKVSTVLVQQKLGAALTASKSAEQEGASKPAGQITKSANSDPGKALAGEHKSKSSAKSEASLGQASPVTIRALRLTYSDPDRKAHYEGGVTALGTDFNASSNEMDVYLLPRSQTSTPQPLSSSGKLDRMIAQGNVFVQEPGRHATGQRLVYTASDDKFILTGGPPSIFDAEHGKITGDSLTFYRADDRVLVEGEASTPVVTQTRVAR